MRVVSSVVLGLSVLSTTTWAVETPTTPTTQPVAVAPTAATAPAATAAKPPTKADLQKTKAQQEAAQKALLKEQSVRLQQLETANLDALAQNQALQLKNDNLNVQLQVLQSERSAQMFLYGAATLGVGVLLGFLIASYIYSKRRHQW